MHIVEDIQSARPAPHRTPICRCRFLQTSTQSSTQTFACYLPPHIPTTSMPTILLCSLYVSTHCFNFRAHVNSPRGRPRASRATCDYLNLKYYLHDIII